MKMLLGVLAVAAFAALSEGSLAPGLRVKFEMGLRPDAGTDYFFNIARTVPEARADGWRLTRRPRRPAPLLPQLTMYCSPKKEICAFYDDLEHVAGLQIALPKDEFTDNVFDWEKRGFQGWNTTVDNKCVFMYAIQQYFVSAEYLEKPKEERLALRDPSRVLQEKAIWVVGVDRELQKISNEQEILKEDIFKLQGCIPWMGRHYYHNMTTEFKCEDENVYPWFPMLMDGELVSSGFITFGKLPVGDPDYFERPPRSVVERIIVPNASHCVYDLVENVGALTMHIYYTSTPWLITC